MPVSNGDNMVDNSMEEMQESLDTAKQIADAPRKAKKAVDNVKRAADNVKKISQAAKKGASGTSKAAAGGGSAGAGASAGTAGAGAGAAGSAATAGGTAAAGAGAAAGTGAATGAATAAGTAAGAAATAAATTAATAATATTATAAGATVGSIIAALSVPALIIIAIILAILFLWKIINPESSTNTSSGSSEEAQTNDYKEDDTKAEAMKKIEAMKDGKEKDEAMDAALRDYTVDEQFGFLAKAMRGEADEAYNEATKRYNEKYNEYANDPKLNDHDDVSLVYQDPKTGDLYRNYEQDPLTGALTFSDKVEPRGSVFVQKENYEDATKEPKEDGTVPERAPSTGIAFVVAAYAVSRGGTTPVAGTADDAKKFAYYSEFKDIVKNAKNAGSMYNYSDDLKSTRKQKEVTVVRFEPVEILEKDNREKSNTRYVPAGPVQETFEYTEYEYYGYVAAFDVRAILEEMFTNGNPFYEDIIGTYSGEGPSRAGYIGSALSGNSEEILKQVVNSWPDQMDPARAELVKQALSAVGTIPYIYGGGHDASVFSPNPSGLDCSGFVSWAHNMAKIDIGLGKAGVASASDYSKLSGVKPITADQLMPGDIVDRSTHVGIYIGRDSSGGAVFVHSSGGKRNTERNPGPGPGTKPFGAISHYSRPKIYNDNQTFDKESILKTIKTDTPDKSKERKKEEKEIAEKNIEIRGKKTAEKKNDPVSKVGPTTNKLAEEADSLSNPDLNSDDVIRKRKETQTAQNNTYQLSNEQLKAVTWMCIQEQGSTVNAVAAEASLMCNVYERQVKKNRSGDGFYKWLFHGVKGKSWFGAATRKAANKKGNPPQELLNTVTNVITRGERSLPTFVNEHDCMSDIASVSNDGVPFDKYDKSKYVRDKTVIKNKYGATYVFWGTYGAGKNPDPFGYTDRQERARNGAKGDAFNYDNFTGEGNLDGAMIDGGPEGNGDALIHILESPYYQWIPYFHYTCDHESTPEYRCPVCGAKPKIRKTGFLWWKKEFTDFEFVQSDFPDRYTTMTVDENGDMQNKVLEEITVKDKILSYAENMVNSIDEVKKYDAGGFDIDQLLRDAGLGSNYVPGIGYVNGNGYGRKEATDLIEEARKHIGKTGSLVWPSFFKDQWCQMFVSFCAGNVNLADKSANGKLGKGLIPWTASPKVAAKTYAANGQFQYASSGYLPQPGDIVFFDWDNGAKGAGIESIDHVGIVISASENGAKIHTIEGNTSGQNGGNTLETRVVAEKDRDRKDVVGYGVPAYSAPMDLKGDTVNEQVLSYLVGKGLTKEAAAGIFGNMAQETGFDKNGQLRVNTDEKKGTGRGIIQWSKDRRAAFDSYMRARGIDPKKAPLKAQLDYMFIELKGTHWMGGPNRHQFARDFGKSVTMTYSEFARLKDYKQATYVFCNCYERPKYETANMGVRLAGASKAMQIMSGGNFANPSASKFGESSTTTPSNPGGSSGGKIISSDKGSSIRPKGKGKRTFGIFKRSFREMFSGSDRDPNTNKNLGYGNVDGNTGYTGPGDISAKQQKVVDAAYRYVGDKKGSYPGYCQRLVSLVYRDAFGTYKGAGSAKAACNMYRVSTRRDNIPIGASVYFTSSFSPQFGHVGIYVGDGKVIDAERLTPSVAVRKMSNKGLGNWAGYIGWGWNGFDMT